MSKDTKFAEFADEKLIEQALELWLERFGDEGFAKLMRTLGVNGVDMSRIRAGLNNLEINELISRLASDEPG